jgi:4-hydroxy-tetrahydrodipicolinate synthase
MKAVSSRATPVADESLPATFLADDATAADQVALAVLEILGRRVITTDAGAAPRNAAAGAAKPIRVINSGTRALSAAAARQRSESLVGDVLAGESRLPVLQIDSRLRGLGNAARGLCDLLDFDWLLLVPAEPELGRLVQDGIFGHVENGRFTPFHQSTLAAAAAARAESSDLRRFAAGELGLSPGRIFSIPAAVVGRGPAATVAFIRGLKRAGKSVLIPDVTRSEHFGTIVAAARRLAPDRVLVAGSRTFLRSYLASFANHNAASLPMKSLAQTLDRQKRGAPLAVVSSLESVTDSQMDYARRAIGPNLVAVSFDARVVLKGDREVQREVARARAVVESALSAARPVLLHTSRTPVATEPAVQRRLLDAISQAVAGDRRPRQVSALFVSGGQTAETLRAVLGITAVEMQGAFQDDIPWGVVGDGPFAGIPLVTKGGRMGRENVLYEFFEQGHPLPRANVLPVVTPLTKQKEVDEAGIEKLIAHLVRLRTTDIFAVGNAGEFRFLTNDRRLQALEIFARKARGKLRVFAGITGDTAEETRRNYQAAGQLGVHAAVVMPLYFLKSSEEIAPFVESLGPIQPKLPLLLYNNPERTNKQNISFEAVEALEFPVVAIKDSSGDLERLDRYARSMPVYEGQQRQISEGWQHGARGSIGIIGHVTSLPNDFYAPETTAAQREEIGRQINDLSKVVKQGGAEVAAYKYLLSLAGIIGDTVASSEPARELTDAQREQIRANNAELITTLRALGR